MSQPRPPWRVLLYVQHLLGVGHLRRALTLARGLLAAELEVTVVSGGMPVSGLSLPEPSWVQLPPAAAADLGFRDLVDAQGRPVDEAWRAERVARLLQAFDRVRPDVLLIELYPFGRRQMRFELLPLLQAARARRPRPLVVSSVRDVLGGAMDPAKQARMQQAFDAHFDRVLVHGDPALIPFGQTYRHVDELGDRLAYTGYVVDAAARASACAGAGLDEVLVSAGGGAVGQRLLEAAIEACRLGAGARRTWRLLAGLNATASDLARLQALAAASACPIVVERHLTDFVDRLHRCALSISQAGYNTTLEVLGSGAPAVLVPFAGGHETEQALRARLLAERGWVECVPEAALDGPSLAAAAARALAKGRRRDALPVDLEGAATSARLLRAWLEAAER